MPHWCFVFNPAAAGGKSGRALQLLSKALDARGLSYTVLQTRHEGDGITRCQEALDSGFRHILVIGGDGTLNEVVNGLLAQTKVDATEVVLGLFPAGTGNDFARGRGIPKPLKKRVEALMRGQSELIDAGVVQLEHSRRYFINMAGAGFDAAVALRANALKNGVLPPKLSYLLALALSLFGYQQQEVRLKFDHSEESLPLFSVLCGNGTFAGNGMKLAPGAQFNDGQFYITRVARISPWKVLLNVHRLFGGTFLHFREVHTHQATEIQIAAALPIPLQADGEPMGFCPAQIRLLPSAIRILQY